MPQAVFEHLKSITMVTLYHSAPPDGENGPNADKIKIVHSLVNWALSFVNSETTPEALQELDVIDALENVMYVVCVFAPQVLASNVKPIMEEIFAFYSSLFQRKQAADSTIASRLQPTPLQKFLLDNGFLDSLLDKMPFDSDRMNYLPLELLLEILPFLDDNGLQRLVDRPEWFLPSQPLEFTYPNQYRRHASAGKFYDHVLAVFDYLTQVSPSLAVAILRYRPSLTNIFSKPQSIVPKWIPSKSSRARILDGEIIWNTNPASSSSSSSSTSPSSPSLSAGGKYVEPRKEMFCGDTHLEKGCYKWTLELTSFNLRGLPHSFEFGVIPGIILFSLLFPSLSHPLPPLLSSVLPPLILSEYMAHLTSEQLRGLSFLDAHWCAGMGSCIELSQSHLRLRSHGNVQSISDVTTFDTDVVNRVEVMFNADYGMTSVTVNGRQVGCVDVPV